MSTIATHRNPGHRGGVHPGSPRGRHGGTQAVRRCRTRVEARHTLVGWSRLLAAAGCLACVGSAATAAAQERDGDGVLPGQAVEDLLPLSQFEDDPIGLDPTPPTPAPQPRKAAAGSAEPDSRYGPTPPPFRARPGEVLTATAAVREVAHAVQVHFARGLAQVEMTLRFESAARGPAELDYRLAAPPGSAPASLEVCNPRGCRRGLSSREPAGRSAYDAALLARPRGDSMGPGGLPIASLRRERDGRGTALRLRAAAVSREAPLQVRLSYVVPTETHGGRTRLRLPPRGMDPRIAATELRLRVTGLLTPEIDGRPASEVPAAPDPRVATELSARLPAGELAVHTEHFPCAPPTRGRCARAWVAAGSKTPRAREVWLAIDLSPSTEGPARNRLPAALATLLASAPGGSRVRALGFASRSEVLWPDPVPAPELPLPALLAPVGQEAHGSATRLESAMPTLSEWLRERPAAGPKPLLVVVGDGGITTGRGDPFARARRLGLEVSVLNLADRDTVPALAAGARGTGGAVLEAGPAAEEARRGLGEARLREQLSALFAPESSGRIRIHGARGGAVALPTLRAGQAGTWTGPVRRRARVVVAGLAGRRSRRAPLTTSPATSPAMAWPDDGALLAVDPRDLGQADDWPPIAEPVPRRRDRRPPACDGRGPALRHSGLNRDSDPISLAHQRACAPPATEQPADWKLGAGMPAEPLLGMLRDRIVPVARGCFRRDRAGRGDYAVRAVFHFRMSEREIIEARVEGKLDADLRECLLRSVDGLEVPRFTGHISVRYPVVTEREPPPARIELSRGTAGELDALLRQKDAAGAKPASALPIP